MEEPTFESDLIHAIMKRIWTLRTLERENVATNDALDSEVAAGSGSSKKNRTTSANASALKLTCELLRVFVTEAVQRAIAIAETEGDGQIEATHLENQIVQRDIPVPPLSPLQPILDDATNLLSLPDWNPQFI